MCFSLLFVEFSTLCCDFCGLCDLYILYDYPNGVCRSELHAYNKVFHLKVRWKLWWFRCDFWIPYCFCDVRSWPRFHGLQFCCILGFLWIVSPLRNVKRESQELTAVKANSILRIRYNILLPRSYFWRSYCFCMHICRYIAVNLPYSQIHNRFWRTEIYVRAISLSEKFGDLSENSISWLLTTFPQFAAQMTNS